MHARMSTIQMDPGKIDEAISQFEEQDLPAVKELDGFRGLTMHVDRASGKSVVVAYYDSKEQLDASEEAVTAIRQRVADTGGAAAAPEVEHFEVALDTFVK
jgi:heme-degrading monooxygenase HmoA